jgi:hypothetical protein
MTMYIHERCWDQTEAKARSFLEAFLEVAGADTGNLNEGDVLAIALAAANLTAEALANFPEPDRSEWTERIVSGMAAQATEIRRKMEAHPPDCPHCARRQVERENVQ